MIYFDFFKFFIRFYFIFCGGTYDSVLVGPRLHGVATGGMGNWGFFSSAPQHPADWLPRASPVTSDVIGSGSAALVG
jgi:hypothetical protein